MIRYTLRLGIDSIFAEDLWLLVGMQRSHLDSLSLPIVKSLETASAGSRMEKIFFDIQDYHAHTSDLSALVAQSGLRQLALYHLVPPPQNALFEKIFSRDLPKNTIVTQDGMLFELPAGSEEIRVITP
jgi:ribonuclease Z